MSADPTYRCDHCGRDVPVSEGADDAIERYLGPICDECSSRLPKRVHKAAERYDRWQQRSAQFTPLPRDGGGKS